MNLEDRLRTQLHNSTADVVVDGATPGAAVARHRQRRNRQRAASAAFAMVAVLGATVIAVGRDDSPAETVAIGDTASDTTTAPAVVVSDDLDWRVVEGNLGELVYPGHINEVDGLLYALSTAPGSTWEEHPDGDFPRAVYRSDDGATWSEVARFDDPWIAGIDDGAGGLLYAVGTAPATDGAGPAVGVHATSTDGGVTWTDHPLPSSPVTPDPALPLDGSFTEPRMAASGETAVYTLTTRYFVDWDQFVPIEHLDGDNFAEPTVDGLEVVRYEADPSDAACAEADRAPVPVDDDGVPAECSIERVVVATTPWADLGVSDPFSSSASELFVSTGGAEPTPVAWPFGDDQVLELEGVDGGFVALTVRYDTDDTGTRLWHSADGASWVQGTLPMSWVDAVGTMGGRLVAVGGDDSPDLLIARSDDGGATWVTEPLPVPDSAGLGDFVTAATVTDHGAVVVVDRYVGSARSTVILHSSDGTTWSSISTSDAGLPADASIHQAFVAADGTATLTATAPGEKSWTIIGN